ncbi:MAG TPA: HDOD domain-containing protein [Spirochaetota bacterium]|nr:HDOD domain-containing protein [Spirochaetota bacterium]HOL56045.1 HDOD domain-containing protein [Spirochaetota bacterium]HPP03191.1 HDOD domain-containing protein [Spirochaetota bacterium]
MNIYGIDEVTEEIIKNCINNGNELVIDTTSLSITQIQKMNSIINVFLDSIGKDNIFDFISYCYKEMLMNAIKANVKRIYFEKNNINYNNIEEYNRGIKNFKNNIMSNLEEYSKLQKEMGYHIHTLLVIKDDRFIISVKNNVKILEHEIHIINEKKDKAKEFKTIDEAFSTIFQSEEGAGLGIIISILMLKKLGLDADAYSLNFDDSSTITSISIPISLITEEHTTIVNELIIKEINDIPHFPENIIKLQEKLNNPDVDIKDISLIISKDPTLTGDILKFSNSALFMLPRKISSLLEAIKLIGLKGLRNIIYSYQTNKILSQRYDINKMKDILNHSYMVAFNAFHIAKKLGLKEELEDCYIGGILHDFGKIVLLGLNPSLINKINLLCHEKGIPVRIIEEITSGYNHSMVGALLAQKWNFPEKLIDAIEFHHKPWQSNKDYKKFVSIIYVANIISHKENSIEQIYNTINKNILMDLGLNDFSYFNKLVLELYESFKK